GVPVGSQISDTATLAGGRNPTGTMTFTLFGPGDTACATPIFTSPRPVTGNGAVTSGAFTANAAGTYRWIASYVGDANNNAVTTTCNAPNESVAVSPTATQPGPAGPQGPEGASGATAASFPFFGFPFSGGSGFGFPFNPATLFGGGSPSAGSSAGAA